MSNRQGNDVFVGKDGDAAQSNWGGPTSDVLKDDFGLQIPTETVPLPSKGMVYDPDHPLFGKETVEIKAMTAREEDILTNRVFIKKKTVISELLKSCLVDKRINPESLIAGDRNALMTALRITGYGAEYRVEVDCPACSGRTKQEFDLSTLPIKGLKQAPVAEGSNCFEFLLPLTKKKVRFKYLTGFDEKDIAITEDRKRKQGFQVSNTITTGFQYQVTSIDHINDKNKLRKFCQNMPARDSLALRKFMDANEPGIEMVSYMNCPLCLEESEVRLPLGASFFWPDE